VLTAVPGLAVLASGDPRHGYWRDPAAIRDGQWWRLGTSLVFQDGGLAGTVFNLATLALVGLLAERSLGAWRTLACYAAGAVAGQSAAMLTHSVGAGNSIAVCGLAGGLLASYARGGVDRLPAAVCAGYCLTMLSTAASGALAGALAAVGVGVGIQLVQRRAALPARLFPGVALAAAVLLAALGNKHGFGMLGGALAGALLPRRTAPAVELDRSAVRGEQGA
jgi:membrane associated rhomboid family serine protease